MILGAAYLPLLGAIVISVPVAWRSSLPAKLPDLPVWRRRLLLGGVIANAISLTLFLAVSFGPRLISSWSPDIYNYRLSVLIAVASILLGAFGTRAPRVFVILNGLVLTWLWFNLAASSL